MTTSDPAVAVLPSYPDLTGKVALVTGGSGGIGSATCRLLAANGARVAVNARDQAAIDSVVGEITSEGGEAIGVSADCTDFTAVERMRQRIENELEPVEILAAFVGGGGARPAPTEQTSEEDWRSFVDGSLTATFLTVKSFLPHMIERRRGAIVTMASTAGRVPLVGPSAAYAAAKAGVIMYTRYLAAEVGKHGIRANCISPGTVLTERLQGVMPEERRQQMAAMTALGRLGTPEDIALATLFLASDASSWLTGVTLDVNGGAVMIDRARRPRREMDGVEMDGQQDKREGTRASDAERERTAEALNQHFLAGRLTAAEYDERLSVAYAARTREDLQGLLADLPPLSEPEAREQPSGPWWRRLHPAVAVFALIATSWLVASLFGGGHPHGFFPLWPLLIWGFVLFRWGPWRLRQRR